MNENSAAVSQIKSNAAFNSFFKFKITWPSNMQIYIYSDIQSEVRHDVQYQVPK